MLKFSVAYGSAAITFLLLDALWLSTMTGLLYRPVLGPILADQVRLVPAIAFYALYLGGIVYFAISPALMTQQWTTALLNGALFGLIAYATYDLTNQATLELWTTKITIADMAWGSFVSATASTAGYLAAQLIVERS